MTQTLVIRLECTDESDCDWLRTRVLAAVEDVVENQKEDGRIDGTVEVSWDLEDA